MTSTAAKNAGNIAETASFAALPRTPGEAVRICLVKYFDFRGRASRSEFWWFVKPGDPKENAYVQHPAPPWEQASHCLAPYVRRRVHTQGWTRCGIVRVGHEQIFCKNS